MRRRTFLVGTAAVFTVQGLRAARAAIAAPMHVATNTYPWGQFARRAGKAFPLHTDESLAAIASAGLDGYEPIINSSDEFEGMAERLQKYGLEMRSLYVNSTLHDDAQVEASVSSVLAIARGAAKLGTKFIVTNPSPIRWGGPENKSDAQLETQAKSLDHLGAELKKLGLTLAYHNHDIELRLGAREFHHMLTATDAENVKFCLDAHWIYRGCGNSQVALFDVVRRYGRRVVELHLRQSHDGIWTEVFQAEGDIDYQQLATMLQRQGVKPHLVLEQAVEKGSPTTLDAVAAHRQGVANVRSLFAANS